MHTTQVSRLASILYAGTCLAMIVALGAIGYVLLQTPLTPEGIQSMHSEVTVSQAATRTQLLASSMLTQAPMVAWVWALNQMRKLFGCFKRGEILTETAASYIQRIGFGFMAISVVQILLTPIQSALLTWSNPPGERILQVSINNDMIGFLLAAGLMIAIGWAMRDAAAAASENKAFI